MEEDLLEIRGEVVGGILGKFVGAGWGCIDV